MSLSPAQISAIVQCACDICSVSPADIYSRSRRFPVITARNMLWLHLRQHCGISVGDIVRHFGFKRRNIQYACAAISGNMRYDRALAALYDRFTTEMRKLVPDVSAPSSPII